jgi:hypothetical protein
MAQFTFDQFWGFLGDGTIVLATDPIHAYLLDGTYVPDKALHGTMADVTGEIVATGYTAGGVIVPVSLSNTLTRRVYGFSSVNWPGFTGSADAVVWALNRGGDPADDQLIGYRDFGGTVNMTAGTFTVADAAIRLRT